MLHYQAKDLMIDRDGLYERGIFSNGIGWQVPRIPGLGDVDWSVVFSGLYRPGLPGRLHHRARGPALRGHRREGQAGLPHRPRHPSAVLQVSTRFGAWAEIAAPRTPEELTPELLADLLSRVTERDVAKTIDHSLLRPELDDAFVEDGCRLAALYDVASVCVRPADVVRARAILAETDVAVGTTIGFPHGNHRTGGQARRGAPGPGGRGDRAGHGAADRSAQVRPRRRRRGRHRGHRRGGPRRRRDRQGHLRERLPHRRREGPCLPPYRGCGGGLREDLDGLRAGRRHPRGPGAHAGQHLAAHPGEGGRRRPDARRAPGGDGPRRDPHRGHRDGDHPRRLPGAEGGGRPGCSAHPGRRRPTDPWATPPASACSALGRCRGSPRPTSCSTALAATQADAIERAARWCADAIAGRRAGAPLRDRPLADPRRGDVPALRLVPGLQPDRRAVDDVPQRGRRSERPAPGDVHRARCRASPRWSSRTSPSDPAT